MVTGRHSSSLSTRPPKRGVTHFPSYGRGPSGEVWKLENELYGLIETCAQALSEEPLFFLINSYTTGFQASVLSNMLGGSIRMPS